MEIQLKTQAHLDLALWLWLRDVNFRLVGHIGNWQVTCVVSDPMNTFALLKRAVDE